MKPGFLRIIAGKWRGRRLKIPAIEGLRPTPDRVRETLFNWLAPYIVGARCLDLFAGSGALGFEALSRGATFVVMVDQSSEVVNVLKSELIAFGESSARIDQAIVPLHLQREKEPFDIVFLDPPYDANLLFPCCRYLEEQGFLAKKAHIYLEANKRIEDNELPSHWRILKSQQAGNVYYHLAYREL